MESGGGLYQAPLYYDVVNTPGTAPETAALIRLARRFAARSGPGSIWLEPACGTGRYLRHLQRRGRRVRGYDAQPAMLEFAAARLDNDAGLATAAFTTPAEKLRDFGHADVAFCPVNSLRHLHTDRDVIAHFEQIAALLADGGVYIVGLDLHVAERQPDEDVWHARRGGLAITQVVQYLPPDPGSRREHVVVELLATRPRGQEHLSFAYDLRTYTERQWTALLARSPLRRLATANANGRPVNGAARLPYQLEVLARR